MTTNTEIKTLDQRIKPGAWLMKGETGNILAASMAEAAELRAALEAKQQALEAAQQVAQRAGSEKPYAYEFGKNKGDGTYSVVIECGDMVQVGPAKYEYAAPAKFAKEHPPKPLYTTPPAAVQPDSRFFMDHGQWHDRVTGQHLWTQDQYDQQRIDWYKQGKEDAMLQQPDSGRDAALACADPVVETNVALLRSRSTLGIGKYGVTLADSKAPLRDWLEHALLELLDCANYLQTAMHKIDAAQQGEQAPAAKAIPDPLRTAVAAFIKARGRYHTEQGYKALVEAFDATKESKTPL